MYTGATSGADAGGGGASDDKTAQAAGFCTLGGGGTPVDERGLKTNAGADMTYVRAALEIIIKNVV